MLRLEESSACGGTANVRYSHESVTRRLQGERAIRIAREGPAVLAGEGRAAEDAGASGAGHS